MTPFLDVLARLEAEATAAPWLGVPGMSYNDRRWIEPPDIDLELIVALRNAAPLLIEVARAAEKVIVARRGFLVAPPRMLAAACDALDDALAALRAETERGKE